MLIRRHAEARAVLADPRYVPPPVRQDGREGTLAWLRAQVSRFSTGDVHAERRRRVVDRLLALDPAELRTAARTMTLERDGDWRGVPTAVLGAALGVRDTAAVPAAASGYLSGEESPQADAAVAELLALTDLPAVTLLLQAHAATEGLIENALAHAATKGDVEGAVPGDAPQAGPGVDVDALLHETLRWNPPLKATRRLDTRTGDEVTIDLVAANRDPDGFDSASGRTPHLTFGYGVRPCPAPGHALALAAGVLEGVFMASLRSAARSPNAAAFPRSGRSAPAAPPGDGTHSRFMASPREAARSPYAAAMSFRDLHRPGDPLLLPNAWDYGSAAILAAHGFPAIGTTSLGVAAVYGKPDAAGATRAETIELVESIKDLGVMVTVDVEGGFSDDPAEVSDLVASLAALGVAGVNLEDGRPDGTLRPIELHQRIIEAATGHGVFVNARTDTCWLRTGNTLERVAAYSHADGVFVPGLSDLDEIAEVAAATPLPLNVLYQPNGPTLGRLAAAGVARVSTGSLLYRAALQGALATVLGVQGGSTPQMPTYAEIAALLGK
ncbi:isocitrate lyase/phosphoenolpyruvate mutase family protein [Nonomuraea sp. H19]|uniref:isocitrate lyase/phosphoenolpyruvate mutase family protein n=1 Tax=Nonomuraea sp. H19 TaxID=3452206 RepID=UPI003F8AC92A